MVFNHSFRGVINPRMGPTPFELNARGYITRVGDIRLGQSRLALFKPHNRVSGIYYMILCDSYNRRTIPELVCGTCQSNLDTKWDRVTGT